MHPQIEAILDEAENRYLNTEELTVINQYVASLPLRLETYRTLRDQELEVMQAVADQLEAALPQESKENLERSLKYALLTLRYCAMGMLLNDPNFIQNRLLNWLGATITLYNTLAIDTTLHRLLNQQLSQVFSPNNLSLLSPSLAFAQKELLQKTPATV